MVESLTRREHEIVALVAEGLTNRELAERLCISEATVRTHLTSIFLKLGVTNRLKLVVYAYRKGLIDPLR
jgi:DNA-binding CsgD family transcriptional regulator